MVDRNSALYQRLVTQYQDLEVIPNKFERGLSGARNTGRVRPNLDDSRRG
jgi:hypothetical protein